MIFSQYILFFTEICFRLKHILHFQTIQEVNDISLKSTVISEIRLAYPNFPPFIIEGNNTLEKVSGIEFDIWKIILDNLKTKGKFIKASNNGASAKIGSYNF